MIKLKQLIEESNDSIIEKFISLLPKYDLEFHSWDSGKEHAFQWRGNTYPTITDKEKIVKVALDRTDLFVRRPGEVWLGDPSRPLVHGYIIQAIVTDPQHRGKGKANEILKRILKAADEAGLLLKLEAVPMKDFIKKKQSKLTSPQLIKWYSKHGFEKHPEASLMIRKPKPLSEGLDNDLEKFRKPLHSYMQKTFPKEYDPDQLLMFGLSMENLINVFINKVFSIKIGVYDTERPSNEELPNGKFSSKDEEIEVYYNYKKYFKSIRYRQYVDSVIFHELIHAINFYKKLWNKITYDSLIAGEQYYSDPEEIRAYRSQLKDFLMGHLGFSRKQAEYIMNRYSSDRSETRKKWIAKYHDLKEIEYPLAKGKDVESSYSAMEGWMGKVVWMTPDKFLYFAPPLLYPTDASLKDIEKKIKRNTPIDYLVLIVDADRNKVISHEGRHRATVAKNLGIEKIPVLILVYRRKGLSDYPRVPQWTQQQHDYIDNLKFRPQWK